MPYWQLYYHLVWSTFNRLPMLTPAIEDEVYALLKAKAHRLEGVVFALNGMPDHVHLVASIPPKVALSHFIGQIKAVAATQYNKRHPGETSLAWQHEYGAFSFDAKRLPNYVAYVASQKAHHAAGRTIPILERTSDSAIKHIAENTAPYLTADASWRAELVALEPPDQY